MQESSLAHNTKLSAAKWRDSNCCAIYFLQKVQKCKIEHERHIGEKAEHKDHWDKEVGCVYIGNNVVITGHVTIDAGTHFTTAIQDECFIMKGVHVGHDAKVGFDVTISPHAILGGSVRVGSEANIGMGAIIHQWCKVGFGAMVGMGAIVTKKSKIHPYGKFVGNPARYLGRNRTGDHLSEKEYNEIIEQWGKE